MRPSLLGVGGGEFQHRFGSSQTPTSCTSYVLFLSLGFHSHLTELSPRLRHRNQYFFPWTAVDVKTAVSPNTEAMLNLGVNNSIGGKQPESAVSEHGGWRCTYSSGATDGVIRALNGTREKQQ